jgi:hypothetical protein
MSTALHTVYLEVNSTKRKARHPGWFRYGLMTEVSLISEVGNLRSVIAWSPYDCSPLE